MKTSAFNYHLPEELIAQTPPEERGMSRLLVLDRSSGVVKHRQFRELPELLQPGDVLVLNDTRVLKTRFRGKKKTGGKIELLVFRDFIAGTYSALAKGSLKEEETVYVGGHAVALKRNGEGRYDVSFPDSTFEEMERTFGVMPLPPYIKREADKEDDDRYQTVFGVREGAVAAPTAALHFSPEILDGLKQKGVSVVFITLHVGPGTFLPVKTEQVEAHNMLPEYFEIAAEAACAINRAKEQGRRVVFCGTTVVRAIESSCVAGKVIANTGTTERFIYPGYKFQMVETMLTNFHLPASTPLMLVCALAGKERIMTAYQEAIERKYRFFSYGDAMLIW